MQPYSCWAAQKKDECFTVCCLTAHQQKLFSKVQQIGSELAFCYCAVSGIIFRMQLFESRHKHRSGDFIMRESESETYREVRVVGRK